MSPVRPGGLGRELRSSKVTGHAPSRKRGHNPSLSGAATGGSVCAVRWKGIRRAVVIAVTAALNLQVASAAATQLTAQLRAAGCCATHCARTVARSCDCCHLNQSADGPMAVRSTSSGGQPAVVCAMNPALVAAPTADAAPLRRCDLAGVGPPLFLAQRSLLL